jgi:hypothetical protein
MYVIFFFNYWGFNTEKIHKKTKQNKTNKQTNKKQKTKLIPKFTQIHEYYKKVKHLHQFEYPQIFGDFRNLCKFVFN